MLFKFTFCNSSKNKFVSNSNFILALYSFPTMMYKKKMTPYHKVEFHHKLHDHYLEFISVPLPFVYVTTYNK